MVLAVQWKCVAVIIEINITPPLILQGSLEYMWDKMEGESRLILKEKYTAKYEKWRRINLQKICKPNIWKKKGAKNKEIREQKLYNLNHLKKDKKLV